MSDRTTPPEVADVSVAPSGVTTAGQLIGAVRSTTEPEGRTLTTFHRRCAGSALAIWSLRQRSHRIPCTPQDVTRLRADLTGAQSTAHSCS